MLKKRNVMLAVLAPLALITALYWLLPGLFVAPLLKANRAMSDLTAHQIDVGDHRVHYLIGGEGDEVLVLLHGIFAEKDHWVEFARPLKKKFRLLIPDLPGFGESTRLEDASYHYAMQSQRLQAFLQALDVQQIHLAGNSMGGAIAARFTLDNPEQVKSLAFIGAPHGIESPIESEMARLLANGEIPLIARNQSEFSALLDFLFVEVPWLPRPLYQHSAKVAIDRASSNLRLWQQQQEDSFRIQQHLDELAVPVLTLWGEHDLVFHVSGIDVLREGLPHGQHEVMAATGHLPMMEYPTLTARLYLSLLDKALHTQQM
ncbi:lipase [Alishewanella longhuensis]|uniref:Lipase n=1 Tax=Alishewanella longhuensis TaxID=1091037 RepID=A0ABQ3KVD4_9ALTE|nr:alpha/beta hydrolase [Alishewanella longhuensis]GHG63096.1 lipase [Alishewanella longhuensis]